MSGTYFLEVDAHTGSIVERLKLATRTVATLPSDTPANTIYDGRILDAGSSQRALTQEGGAFTQSSISDTLCTLANADRGLDAWMTYGFSGRRFLLSWQDGGAASVMLRGTTQGLESTDASKTLRLRARGRLVELDKPLLTRRYLGTTITAGATAEGNTDLTGTIVPYIFGSVINVPLIQVNEFDLIHQACGNAVASIAVYDGGIPLPVNADYGTLAALVAATIPIGQVATCLALGLVRVAAEHQATLTADVVEGASAAIRTAGQISLRMLALITTIVAADIDTASFTALDVFNDAEVGIYINGDDTATSLIEQVLQSVGAALMAPAALGVFTATWIDDPALGTSVKTFTERDCLNAGATFQIFAGPSSEGDGVPAYSVALSWGRVWRPMSASDLLGDPMSPSDPVGGSARRDYLGRETRTSIASDAAVQIVHLLAPQLTGVTLLTMQADADAESARRLALNKVRRDRLAWPVPLADADGIMIGNVVTIDMNMYGYDAGRPMRVIGLTADFTKRVMTLDLWG